MRFHLLIAALLIAGIGTPSGARGCSCAAPDAAEAKRISDVVFVGTVESFSFRLGWLLGRFLGVDGSHKTRLRISEVFKGDLDDGGSVVLVGNRDPNTCGFPFEVGETLVVYGLERNGVLEVHPCAWTFPTQLNEETLRWLRAEPKEIYRAPGNAV